MNSKKIEVTSEIYQALKSKANQRGLTVPRYLSRLVPGHDGSKGTVRLTIEIPKGVMNFLEDFSNIGGCIGTVKDYIEQEVAQLPEAIFGSLSNVYFNVDWIREKYGLQEDKKDP